MVTGIAGRVGSRWLQADPRFREGGASMKSKSKPNCRFSYRELVKSVELSPPAVRLLVLTVDVLQNERGEIENEVQRLCVVGIESSIIHHFTRLERDGVDDGREYASEQELRNAGFQFLLQEVRHDPLFVSPDDDGCLESVNELRQMQSEVFRLKLVACDWPQKEDNTRLAPLVEAIVGEMVASLDITSPSADRGGAS